MVKNLPVNAEDAGDSSLIPVSRRSLGVGNCNPLQYSGLENSMDRGAWRAPWSSTESDTTEQLTLLLLLLLGTWEQDLIRHIIEAAQKSERKGRWGLEGRYKWKIRTLGSAKTSVSRGQQIMTSVKLGPKLVFVWPTAQNTFFKIFIRRKENQKK